MTTTDLCRLCAETYYWKPMQGFFSVLTLKTYLARPLRFEPPVLDLGCSDGLFGSLLSRVHNGFSIDAGFDIDGPAVRRAGASGVHRRVLRADARALPFRSGCFSTAFSNGVLCCVPGGVDEPLAEVFRVLRPGGLFLFTMPTPAFAEILLMPRLLRRAGLVRLAGSYVAAMNARLHHVTVLAQEEMAARVRRHGLIVEGIWPFFSRREASIWDVLSLHVWRVFGLLRKAPAAGFLGRAPLRAFLQSFYRRDNGQEGPFGYMLIVARKG